jgi:RNA-directed DNA polymerase
MEATACARPASGAPGSDDETFEKIEAQGRGEFLAKLAGELRADAYHPRPYRRREIPKEGGKVRVISIPAIRDRVVQGALRLILEPIFEAYFSDSSYGARPGRSAHEAIEKVRSGLRQGRHRAVDVDLSRYFDTIRHDRILAKVAGRVVDGNVLARVKQFLKSTGDRGVPQGSPLSPLLANLALDDLDHALDRGGGTITYARYLDDMVVLAADTPKGRQWADRALARIRREAEAIGVSLNVGSNMWSPFYAHFPDHRHQPGADLLHSCENRGRQSMRDYRADLDSHGALHPALHLPRRRVVTI